MTKEGKLVVDNGAIETIKRVSDKPVSDEIKSQAKDKLKGFTKEIKK